MKFVSTRGEAPAADLSSALLAGLAPDGGLYVPERIESVPDASFAGAVSLPQIARVLLGQFFDGDPLAAELQAVADESLDLEAPTVEMAPHTDLLELFHGPTAAFKDFGARFLARVLLRLRPGANSEAPLTILVATSGDTGSAVAAAFRGIPGFRVVVLYPENGVSARQAHQLGAMGETTVALRLPATFDRCQSLVTEAFADTELRARVPLSSANSISLGRLLPQMAYYALAALRHARAGGEPVSFIVPTGNLGNAVAALMTRRAGLPIDRILFATNANRTIPEFVATGDYRPRPSLATLANAMDVGDPSNASRLRFMMMRDPELARSLVADAVDDDAIRERIRSGEKDYGRIFCPHTACAVEVLERERRAGSKESLCVVATAHPAKFEQVVEPLVGHIVPVPPSLQVVLAREARTETLEPDYGSLKARLLRL